MKLTQRAEKIIRILVRFPQDNPVTVRIIAEELNISDRSVQRELLTVEKWLAAHNFCFLRKRSVGLILDESAERKKELLALLDQNNGSDIMAEGPKERQSFLCRSLLFSNEPFKSYYFTDKFGISDGTLTADLNQLSDWFKKYHLKLVRRPGLGIFLDGSEIARRQAITSYLCNLISENDYLGNLRKSEVSSDILLDKEINTEIISQVNLILADCEKQLNLQLSDNAYLYLLVYTSIAIQRIKQDFFIKNETLSFSKMSIEPEYAVAEYIMKQLRRIFHLTVSVDETLYLAAYLSGIHIWPSANRDLTEKRNLNVHQITLAVIKKTGEVLNLDLSNDEQLLRELSAHIQPTIGRLRAGIPVENPLLSDFQNSHPDVYHACEEGMLILSHMLGIESVPASETGLITLYFVMAVERIEK